MNLGRLRPRYRAPATNHILATVDLGARRCGVSAWRVEVDRRPAGQLIAAEHELTVEIVPWVIIRARGIQPPRQWPIYWVIEVPHLRGDARAQHRGVEALLEARDRIRADAITAKARAGWKETRPAPWKGNVPKEVHHRRAFEAMTVEEVAVLGGHQLNPNSATYQHDTADAIALGLWALGRVGRGGVVRPQGGAGAPIGVVGAARQLVPLLKKDARVRVIAEHAPEIREGTIVEVVPSQGYRVLHDSPESASYNWTFAEVVPL